VVKSRSNLLNQIEKPANPLPWSRATDELAGKLLFWDAALSHLADTGIQPALQSDHHKASDERTSADQNFNLP